MLKQAIYLNVYLLFIMSIFYLINIKKGKLYLKPLLAIYMFYTFISFMIFNSDLIDTGWDFIYVGPITLISFIICIVGLVKSNKKENNDSNKKPALVFILAIIPFMIYIIPYLYELYVINNCTYLINYNYQNGFVTSDDTYLAILNKKPVTITLQKNIFGRTGEEVDSKNYTATYNSTLTITTRDNEYNKIVVNNDSIKSVAQDVKTKNEQAKSADIYYFKEKDMSIVRLLSEDGHGSVLGEYLYYEGKFIQSIQTSGNIKTITYYE